MEKSYNFVRKVIVIERGWVLAKNEEEARENIIKGEIEDIIDTEVTDELCEILELEFDEDYDIEKEE